MDYRVDELAELAGISVELVRSYQSKGLVPPPRHEGRVAHYGEPHLERLRAIREMKDRGYSLRTIADLLKRDGDLPTAARMQGEAAAIVGGRIGDEPAGKEEALTLRELAQRTGVPTALLRSLEGSGVIRPRPIGKVVSYTTADVRAVRMLLSLLGGGMPLEEFMKVARVQLDTAQEVADGAVDLFLTYVREPLLASGLPQKEEAERLAAAFRLMLHAATALMTYNFQRMVLNSAYTEIERRGSRAERAALAREVERRRLELVIPA
jgi:DNA-binding transcriptional MerR regulator